ncbi:MAG: glycine--tRNA ligase subunit beta [Gallionellaceae bacterium]|nr:glycine--tRNA ligase subunit beta [Gallionellaceae bacterium]
MTASKNLLVELHVEELPPKSLKKLGDSFAEVLAASLKNQGLAASDARVTAYASPRRLAVHLTSVAAQAADKSVAQKLMPVSVGLDAHGQPTPALLKKLASLGVNVTAGADASVVSNLKRAPDGKTEALFFDSVVKGATLAEGLQKALDETLAKLPIAKVMTYQRYPAANKIQWTNDKGVAINWANDSGKPISWVTETVHFVRPAHNLIALYGTEIVPVSALSLTAGRATQGHRFEAASAMLEIRDADSYEAQMESEGAVIPGFEKRRAEIAGQLAAAAAREGLQPINDDALLDEVTALVERPNVLLGKFESEFLAVPQECLILTMKANQKYFPLLDKNGKLTNKFLIVSNIRPADASLVIGGNERVVRPRLADAKFFFDQDRKKPLDSRVHGLDKVVYHNKLGSQGDRVNRVQTIARAIGQQLGSETLALQADQAALLSKADLLTDMVGEFPELQGIMGRYYAQHDRLSDDIAYAIEDHYKPRFAGDELPRNRVGICVALADKLETLVGMFGIGQIPTGDKDPFALRRHALGVIRIMTEVDCDIKLSELVSLARDTFSVVSDFDGARIHHDVMHFIYDRYSGMLKELEFTPQEIEAVLSIRPQPNPSQVIKRIHAVRAFAALPEAAALAAANKRVSNILKKSENNASGEVDAALLQEPAEQALHRALSQIAPKADAAFAAGDYTASLQALAALRVPVDAFFDSVMVNVEDAALRANRLALLAQLQQAMNRVADISKLAA